MSQPMSMATPRPQLNPDEMRRLKWLLGGSLALVSLWTVFFLEVEALSLVLVASAIILASMIWPQLPARLPKLIWRLAAPAIVIAVVTDFYFSKDTLPALIRLAVLLVLYRAVSYRRKREDLQLIVLGLFLIVVAGVLTVSLGFAFLLLLFTACALGFLFNVTLIDMTDTGPRVMRPEEMHDVPAWAKLGWRSFFIRLYQVADWRVVGFAAGLFVLVVGFSAVLFTIIPRFEMGSGFFLDKYITRTTRTGFSEMIRFGQVSELVQDNSVAMRVDLTDPLSVREELYWRLIVLDEYTPQGFRLSGGLKKKLTETEKVRQTILGRINPLPTSALVGGTWTFYVEPEVSRFLPLPGSFATLRLRDALPVQMSREQQLIALRSESMAMAAFQLDGVSLSATLLDPEFARVWRHPLSGASSQNYDQRICLRGPSGVENEATLQRVIGEISQGMKLDAVTFARQATDWLRAKHSYALSSHIPAGPKDDIVKWLESNEPGFCEYFAASLTVLCRAAGHPARVVAGFHGGTLNAFEKYYLVRNSQAHAWAEIFDGQGAWFRADPTPGAAPPGTVSAPTVAQRKPDSSWRARLDSLRVLWYRRIVNFDARQQVAMLEDVKTFTTDTGSALRKRLELLALQLKAWLAEPWDFARTGKVMKLLGALGLMVWALLRAIHWTRQAWRMWQQPGTYDPVRNEAGRWLNKIIAQREATPAPNGQIERVHGDLLRLRYGPRETWPEPQEVFRQARRTRRTIKQPRV